MLILKNLLERKSRQGADNGQFVLLMGLGAIALGFALQINNGSLHPIAILFLTIAVVLIFLSVLSPPGPRLFRNNYKPVEFVLVIGLLFQLGQLFVSAPGIYLQLSEISDLIPYFIGLIAVPVIMGTIFLRNAWTESARIPLLVITYLLMGVWLIKSSPNPFIDVYLFQKEGVTELLSGNNPYAMSYANIYGHSKFYGPGLADNTRLFFGFPYPPLSLLFAVPGQVFAGDYRYSQLFAICLSALFMAYARSSRLGTVAAALFLFTPRTFFVLEQGWTEPYIVLLLSAAVYFACRRPKWLAVPLGLFLVIKQYMIFTVPLLLLIIPWRLLPRKEVYKQIITMVAVGLVVSFPLAIWNLPAFWKNIVALQLRQPFRADALSYLALFSTDLPAYLTAGLSFLAAFLAIGFVLWRAPLNPSGFAAGVALVYIVFFAFNKQAFCNYYYFVVGAICCAIAATRYETPGINEPGIFTGG